MGAPDTLATVVGMNLPSLAMLVVVLAATAAAQVVVVPVSGGGAALQNAILAAPNDAVLLVAPGTYSAVSAGVAKNVNVVAPAGATVVGGFGVTFIGVWRLTVVGIAVGPTGQYPFVTGGVLSTNGDLYAEQCSASGLVVTAAGGTRFVRVQGGYFGGFVVNQLQNVHAVLQDATFIGYSSAGQVGHDALQITGSSSLRAERITATGIMSAYLGGMGLTVSGDAVLVDCTLTGGIAGPGQSWAIYGGGSLTLSNCTINGPVFPTPVLRTVPSATWVSENWTPGGTSVVRFQEAPNELVATVASLDLVPWTAPFAMERLYVGATPGWLVTSLGVTGANGEIQVPFTLPNTPAAQYATVWLTGVFVDPFPLRTTCPLGGVVQ